MIPVILDAVTEDLVHNAKRPLGYSERVHNRGCFGWGDRGRCARARCKDLYDMWVRHQERRGIAGALAGEIGAYITLLKPMQTANSFRKIATIERKERVKVLRAMPAPPNNHPVFDAVAHKIGLLSAQDALDTSAFYNVVTGFRIHVTNFASEKFLDAQDEIHTGLLNSLAETIEAEAPKVELLVKRLQRTASERFWSRISWSSNRQQHYCVRRPKARPAPLDPRDGSVLNPRRRGTLSGDSDVHHGSYRARHPWQALTTLPGRDRT